MDPGAFLAILLLCLVFHGKSSPGLFPPPPTRAYAHAAGLTLVHRRPQSGSAFSTLIAYGLHRGTAEQRSSELLLAQLVT